MVSKLAMPRWFVAGLCSCDDVVDSAVNPPNTTHHLHPELTPGPRVISHKEGLEEERGRGGAGIVNRAEWFLLLEPQGRRVLPHPGKVSPFGPSSQPSPSFLGVHARKKKSLFLLQNCCMCNVSAHARGVCKCVCLTYRQSNCSFSIVPLPSFVHVADLLCELSVAPEEVAAVVDGGVLACTLWTKGHRRARTHTHT